MKFIFRTVVFMGALLTLFDKVHILIRWVGSAFFKRAEKKLQAEFGLWWMSGPSEIVHRKIYEETQERGMKAAKTEKSIRTAAVFIALYAHRRDARRFKDGSLRSLISEGVSMGIDQALDIARTHVRDYGLDPQEIETYFSRSN